MDAALPKARWAFVPHLYFIDGYDVLFAHEILCSKFLKGLMDFVLTCCDMMLEMNPTASRNSFRLK